MTAYDPQFTYEFDDQSQNFEFQSFQNETYSPPYQPSDYSYGGAQQNYGYPPGPGGPIDNNFQSEEARREPTEFDEPPLLEELEIFPERILQKSLAVLNPFHSKGLADDADYLFKENDLAGPIAFCLALAVCLFLSGSKIQFGYIYGLSMISVIMMYILMQLMVTSTSTENYITVSSVASILGYSILPIVWLSILGIFIALNTKLGMILAGLAVFLATAAASRIFCLMTGDQNQRFLLAYPCCLVYLIFVLLVLF
jgi:hypothetical protein